MRESQGESEENAVFLVSGGSKTVNISVEELKTAKRPRRRKNQYYERKFWVSGTALTIQTNTDKDGIIVWTAAIARRFIGQHIVDLYNWLHQMGPVAIIELAKIPTNTKGCYLGPKEV